MGKLAGLVKTRGTIKLDSDVQYDAEEIEEVNFTLDTYCRGTDEHPLTSLHIFGWYTNPDDEEMKKLIKFEIPLTKLQTAKLITLLTEGGH